MFNVLFTPRKGKITELGLQESSIVCKLFCNLLIFEEHTFMALHSPLALEDKVSQRWRPQDPAVIVSFPCILNSVPFSNTTHQGGAACPTDVLSADVRPCPA